LISFAIFKVGFYFIFKAGVEFLFFAIKELKVDTILNQLNNHPWVGRVEKSAVQRGFWTYLSKNSEHCF